jgi:hypothetical protein
MYRHKRLRTTMTDRDYSKLPISEMTNWEKIPDSSMSDDDNVTFPLDITSMMPDSAFDSPDTSSSDSSFDGFGGGDSGGAGASGDW